MADYIVKDTELTSIANAIRTAGGTSSLLTFPNGFINAVNNISGGGGSSDFSIAEVTVVNNAATNIEIIAPLSTQYGSIGSQNIKKDTTGTYEVIVPNNNIALLYFSTFGTEVSLSVTGSIELDGNDCLITGDCTITIS